jgi:hypothetical protein
MIVDGCILGHAAGIGIGHATKCSQGRTGCADGAWSGQELLVSGIFTTY